MESRCTASVFTTTVRAPCRPMRGSRSTEFPPAPPHPTTTTFGLARANESRNDWFPVRCTVSRPIPDPSQAVPVGTALLARPRVALPCHGPICRPLPWPCGAGVGRTRGPHFGPRPRRKRSRPTSRAAEVHHVPLRQFDHELADVIRRELDVDETIDRRADRVGDRRVRSALHELVEGLHFVRRQPDRDPLRFG